MIRTTGIFIIIFLSLNVLADNDKTHRNLSSTQISGKVVDHLTGENLAGVKIQVLNSDITVYTDLDGNFNLEFREIDKESHVQISYISYETTVIQMKSMSNSGEIKILPVARQ